MKPKIYNLYYFWYEENSRNEFTHPSNKLKAEFEQDCHDLLQKYAPEFILTGGATEDREFKSWIGANDFISLIASKLPELGYVPIDDTFEEVSFGVFGSNILTKEDGDEDIVKLLGDNLSNMVYEHNEEIERKMNERIDQAS